MAGRAEEVRLAAKALGERLRRLARESPGTAPAAALAEGNALVAAARDAVPGSALIAAMRPLASGSTLAELATRLAALDRAITFV